MFEIPDTKKQFEELIQEIKRDVTVIPSFSPRLDSQFDFGGMELGTSVMVMAPHGSGKTYILTNLINVYLKNKIKTVLFSFDMPLKRIFMRVARILQGLERTEVHDYVKISEEEFRKSLQRKGYFDNLLLISDDNSDLKQNPFNAIEQTISQYKPQVVLIDHFDAVFGTGKNVYQETVRIAQFFREAKVRHNVLFIILLQLNKAATKQHRTPPMLADGKGAGQVIDKSDVVIAMCNPSQEPNCTESERGILRWNVPRNRLNDDNIPTTAVWKFDPVTTIVKDETEQEKKERNGVARKEPNE